MRMIEKATGDFSVGPAQTECSSALTLTSIPLHFQLGLLGLITPFLKPTPQISRAADVVVKAPLGDKVTAIGDNLRELPRQ